MSNPRGYNQFLLAADVETSGLAFNQPDPSIDADGTVYQIVSVGLAVVDQKTLSEIDHLYLEIKWDGQSEWSQSAQKVHGLSLEYLERNGVDAEDAVTKIAELIIKYWGPSAPVSLLGHNVATFDLPFIRRLLHSHGVNVKFSSRHVDTYGIGLATFGTHNSDDLFAEIGLVRDASKHNALEDARASLSVVKTIRTLFSSIV